MSQRARQQLRRQEINLYDGDYLELRDILAPKKITPGHFIRELVHHKIAEIKNKVAQSNPTLEAINVDTGLTNQGSATE